MTASAVLTTALASRREQPGVDPAASAPDLVAAAVAMAARFRAGGALHAFGDDTADAHHIAVEFVHPVIVGKRALPAVAHDGLRAAHLLRHAAGPADIALAVGARLDGPTRDALRVAGERGLLTVALTGPAPDGVAVDHLLAVPGADPLVVREQHVTLYHLLWELTHAVLERSP
ncbi:hypothetical protein ACFQY4_12930 [Catellatospora bangladeshensis]|uniref:Phosphoheptose isomerase n=1 Tax=Catellatospora bangladeshensis TaxID=310355 RepID=A0A8J3K000_9ACTN|nr:hypothetical protein [Catellatospora bangladeshensis]GIF86109.1 phosphoheptose isomerase [Catellatospora bangladeshensis]